MAITSDADADADAQRSPRPTGSRGLVAWWPTVVLVVVLVLLVLGFPARGVGMCVDGIDSGFCTEQVLSWKGSVSWPTASWFTWFYLGVTVLVATGLVASVVTNLRRRRPKG